MTIVNHQASKASNVSRISIFNNKSSEIASKKFPKAFFESKDDFYNTYKFTGKILGEVFSYF